MFLRNSILKIMGNQWLIFLLCSLHTLGGRVHGNVGYIKFVDGAVEKGAVCLDGSPAAYFFSEGTGSGVDNWLVFLEGGAWCASNAGCIYRTKLGVGSSYLNGNNLTLFNYLETDPAINPDFYTWNRVFVIYCDGSSFLGDVEGVDHATNLTYRGSRIFDAVMDELLSRGMKNAKNALLTGMSAGGIATMFHCDGFRSLIPNADRVKCIVDAGLFIYGKHLGGSKQRKQYYANMIKMHGMERFLPKSCVKKYGASRCVFPENFVNDIETPLLLVESFYDQWQIENKYIPFIGNTSDWGHCLTNLTDCTPTELHKLQDFQKTYLDALRKVKITPSRGLLAHNCYTHAATSYLWNCPFLEGNMSISKVMGDWYFDRKPINMIIEDHNPRNCSFMSQAEIEKVCIKR